MGGDKEKVCGDKGTLDSDGDERAVTEMRLVVGDGARRRNYIISRNEAKAILSVIRPRESCPERTLVQRLRWRRSTLIGANFPSVYLGICTNEERNMVRALLGSLSKRVT